MRYPVVIHKDLDSDYGVTIPDLPGCFSAGETFEDALKNAQEAILTHIEGLLLDNDPVSSPTLIEKLRNNIPGKDLIWAIVSVDLNTLSESIKRINITIPERILSKIDSFAKNEGESRSGFLVSAAMEYISHHNAKSLK